MKKKNQIKLRKKFFENPPSNVTGWSIELEWDNGHVEKWSDCDSYLDTQAIDNGISQYEDDTASIALGKNPHKKDKRLIIK